MTEVSAGWRRIRPAGLWACAALFCLLLLPGHGWAGVVRVEILSRTMVGVDQPFGDAGVYERLVGRIYFAFDPENPRNLSVVDLALAPRNEQGLVEAWSDFVVLQPADPARRRGVAWIEVPNRGRRASLRYFQQAPASPDLNVREDFGDGLLMRSGLTLIWVGWQQDLPDREGLLLHLRGPAITAEGWVRSDWTVDESTDVLLLGHRSHRAYSVADERDPGNVLTVRDSREGDPEVVDRDLWSFTAQPEATPAMNGGPNAIQLEGGFSPGHIYELVYRGRDPVVTGLGLLAVRDIAAYAKYDLNSEFPVRKAIGFGVSQTGRFLRHFLYQGFNADEANQKVYDGLFVHSAGAGRGSFNHRFAQPSRDAHRYSAFFYPTDIYPFASRPVEDQGTGNARGLMDQTTAEHLPLVFFTNSGYEYWGRAASLIHTTPGGTEDLDPLPSERIYHLAGGQHSVGSFPPDETSQIGVGEVYRGNPVDFFVTLRALALRLVSWVDTGEEPPVSHVPLVAEGTLVPVGGLAFPPIPGVDVPTVAHTAYRMNYGRRWEAGIIDHQPPFRGPPFVTLVPQVDGLGNEMAGVRPLELLVPLATYTPWSLRLGAPGAVDELRDFQGTYVPLPQDEVARRASGDPRPSAQALYGTNEAYLKRARAAARRLVLAGYLLSEDVPRVLVRAQEHWAFVTREGR